jgi:anti-sigma B factor antagonist
MRSFPTSGDARIERRWREGMMKVKTTKLGVATYLAPDGPLTEENVRYLSESIESEREKGSVNLVVDLRNVPFLDSRGLEYLFDSAVNLRELGGSLRVVNANSVCKDVFSITRVDQTVLVCEDLESAGRSFL